MLPRIVAGDEVLGSHWAHDYAVAHDAAGLLDDVRAGQIVGTASLVSIRTRTRSALTAPTPFDGELDLPSRDGTRSPGQPASRASSFR